MPFRVWFQGLEAKELPFHSRMDIESGVVIPMACSILVGITRRLY
jgi:hypothetical protein